MLAYRRAWAYLARLIVEGCEVSAVQDLRHALKGDPWAVTTIAGHSEEVERKF